jgi:hypothetical protein
MSTRAATQSRATVSDGRERQAAHGGQRPRWPRLRQQAAGGVEQGDVPRLEHLHLLHHPARRRVGTGEVREVVEGGGHGARRLELPLAVGAAPDVRPQRRDAEADLAVEQQVDLV